MKINWISKEEKNASDVNSLIEIEYRFRRELVKIMSKLAPENLDNLEEVEVDFCTAAIAFKVSRNTPEPFFSELSKFLEDHAISFE